MHAWKRKWRARDRQFTLERHFWFSGSVRPGLAGESRESHARVTAQIALLIIRKLEKPTTAQLTFLRSLTEFENSNLLQVRKALQSGELELGPHPIEYVERDFLPAFEQAGFIVSLRELTQAEKQAYLT